jgi:phosphatidylglycerophosphate synthase
VDAGWHLGEGVMPFMVIVIVATLIPMSIFQYWSFVALWIFILFVVGDMIITSIRVKKAAKEKFGESRLEKGLGWYAAMRTVQMRFMRLPKAQVKRGQYPV